MPSSPTCAGGPPCSSRWRRAGARSPPCVRPVFRRDACLRLHAGCCAALPPQGLARGREMRVLNFTIQPLPWSPCHAITPESTIQTRGVTLCAPSGECWNATLSSDPHGIFRLTRECEIQASPVVAMVVIGIALFIVVLGCMWKCGCFYTNRARVVAPT